MEAMKILRFEIISKGVTRIVSVGIIKHRPSKKLYNLRNKIKEHDTVFKDVMTKVLNDRIEKSKNETSFIFAHCITNGHYTDEFDLVKELQILEGRLYKEGKNDMFTIKNKFYHDDMLDDVAASYTTYIVKTVMSKFRNSKLDMDDIEIKPFNPLKD